MSTHVRFASKAGMSSQNELTVPGQAEKAAKNLQKKVFRGMLATIEKFARWQLRGGAWTNSPPVDPLKGGRRDSARGAAQLIATADHDRGERCNRLWSQISSLRDSGRWRSIPAVAMEKSKGRSGGRMLTERKPETAIA